MSITLNDMEQMIKNLRVVQYGDNVTTEDILSLKNVCKTLITYLKNQGWADPELDFAEQKLNEIPLLKHGDVAEHRHRQHLNDAIMYIDEAIKCPIDLEIIAARPFWYCLNIKFSPDGKYLALCRQTFSTLGNTMYLLRVPTLEIVNTIPSSTEDPNVAYMANAIDFSPDGKYVAIAGMTFEPPAPPPCGQLNNYIDIRTVPDLNLVARYEIFEGYNVLGFNSIDYSPDGKYIAIPVVFLDTDYWSGIELRKSPSLEIANSKTSTEWSDIWFCKFSPDGKYIAISDNGNDRIELLDSLTLNTIKRFEEEGWYSPYGIDFSPDGQNLAVAYYGSNGFIILKVPELTKVIKKSKSTWNSPFEVVYTPTRKYVISGFDSAYAFEIIMANRLLTLSRIEGEIFDSVAYVDVSPDGKYLATASPLRLSLLKSRYGYRF